MCCRRCPCVRSDMLALPHSSHTHSHRHMLSLTHARTHTHSLSLSHTRTHTHILSLTHARTHSLPPLSLSCSLSRGLPRSLKGGLDGVPVSALSSTLTHAFPLFHTHTRTHTLSLFFLVPFLALALSRGLLRSRKGVLSAVCTCLRWYRHYTPLPD